MPLFLWHFSLQPHRNSAPQSLGRIKASRNFPGGEGRAGGFDRRPPLSDNTTQARTGPHERGERGGIFGLGVVLRSLIEIALVILPFAIYRSIKRRNKRPRAQGSINPVLDA